MANANKGGTFKQAKRNAAKWLVEILNDGFLEVSMSEGRELRDGNFEFIFTHVITKKANTLIIHGYTFKKANTFILIPRTYWNGSSTKEPSVEDWKAHGFKHRIIYETENKRF